MENVFYALIAVICAILLIFLAIQRTLLLKRLHRAKKAKVKDLKDGDLALLEGTVTSVDKQIVSSITKAPCLAVKTEIGAGKEAGGKNLIVLKDRRFTLFEFSDETGSVLVRAERTNFVYDRVYMKSEMFSELDVALQDQIRMTNENDMNSDRQLKLREFVVRSDRPVTILGTMNGNAIDAAAGSLRITNDGPESVFKSIRRTIGIATLLGIVMLIASIYLFMA